MGFSLKKAVGISANPLAIGTTLGIKTVIDKVTGKPVQVPADDSAAFDAYTASLKGVGAEDKQRLLAEADQENLNSKTTASNNTAARAKYLKDLAGLLRDQQNNDFNANAPGIMEDLNNRGVFRSSGLGNAFAKEQGRLSATTSNTLAQQGIADSNADLAAQTGITNDYNANLGGAVKRQLSIEDYANQLKGGKLLGQATAPIAPTPTKSGAPLQGALGGASAGAPFGPAGAGIGAGAGLLLGMAQNKNTK